MITFSNLGKKGFGRLGNQLFQIASTMGIAEKNNTTAIFPQWGYSKYFEPIPNGVQQFPIHKEQSFEHYDINDNNIDLHGWFQSEKYFGSTIPKLKNITKELNTIAVSIRRGDYIGNPNYYEIPIHWYISALLSIDNWQQHKILFFSDDIEYCHVHFECLPNAEFCSGTDIQQLQRMASCEKHIIANSTFSWWGAYLSESTQVIHSGKLFAGRLSELHTGADFYPERWIKFEGCKLDLKDVTFTIPVFFDHPDRKQNLDLSLCLLQRSFDTNIIVMENNGNKFEYISKWVRYEKSEHKVFHRTKMLNDMCNIADAPIVSNYDCDVIIPPMQIWLSVESIRNGTDISYPYDGRFARVPRIQWFKQLELRLDIGIVQNNQFKGKYGTPMPISSVGGCLFYNKESFIDAGMENENFLSYGPEDCERYDRFNILGLKVERIKGALYHIDHYIGVNSSKQNPHHKANEVELNKIRSLNRNKLLEYIDTWGWVNKYTPAYYKRISEGSAKSAKEVFNALSEIGVNPKSVLDVGCGIGAWKQGGIDWYGIDYNIPKDALFDGVKYVECNLSEAKEFTYNADMAICLEVAEHLPIERAEWLVNILCKSSDIILFSAAIPYQGGSGHINEQWQTWWEKLFNDNVFGAAKIQPNIRGNKNIEMWYRQNIILYVRGGKGTVQDYVLPEYYEQCIKNALGK